MQNAIRNALRNVIDPEVNKNIVDLGLVKKIEIQGEKAIIELIPTSALCPLAIHIAINAKKEAEKIEGLKEVKVYIKGHIMEHLINEAVNK